MLIAKSSVELFIVGQPSPQQYDSNLYYNVVHGQIDVVVISACWLLFLSSYSITVVLVSSFFFSEQVDNLRLGFSSCPEN